MSESIQHFAEVGTVVFDKLIKDFGGSRAAKG